MKTTLLLIRHGETAWNKELRFQGCTDIPLCEEGIQQAKLLAKRLEHKFDIIYASPLDRALKTAKILGGDNLSPILCEDLREINFGSWEGHTLDSIRDTFPTEYHTWKKDKDVGKLMGGDNSIKDASLRGMNAVLKLVEENKGKTIAAVAHGGLIKAALIGLFGWDMTMYHNFFLGNTSITTLRFNSKGKPVLVSLNDTNHLEVI